MNLDATIERPSTCYSIQQKEIILVTQLQWLYKGYSLVLQRENMKTSYYAETSCALRGAFTEK
jgi:hypothetical protein